MSNKAKSYVNEPVTDCHGFRQPYDFLVRLNGAT